MSLEDEIGQQYEEFIKEVEAFQGRILLQAKSLRESKLQTLQKFEVERTAILHERDKL